MNPEDFLRLVGDLLKVSNLTEDAAMGETSGWDSMRHLDMIFALEEKLGASIPPDMMGELVSFKSLLAYFQQHGAVAHG